jgi:hypothetical protein
MKSMSATMDLATGKQIDLNEAATAVGKAFEGQEGVLTRLGIVIPKMAEDSGKAATAMSGVEKTFEEFRTSVAEGAEGSMNALCQALASVVAPSKSVEEGLKQLGIRFEAFDDGSIAVRTSVDELAKKFESGKISSEQMGMALESIGRTVTETSPKADKFAAAMGSITDKFGGAAQKDVETYAGKMTQFQNKLGELMEKVGGALMPFLTQVADVLIKIVDKITWFVEQLTNAYNAIKGLFDGMAKFATDAMKGITDAIGAAGKGITDVFHNLSVSLVGASIWTDLWDEMVDKTSDSMARIKGQIGGNLGTIHGDISGFAGGGAGGPSTMTVHMPITIQVQSLAYDTDFTRLAEKVGYYFAERLRGRT